MITPGGTLEYDIRVMKSQEYTLDEIFEKNLLLLIPFYIFQSSNKKGKSAYNYYRHKIPQPSYGTLCLYFETVNLTSDTFGSSIKVGDSSQFLGVSPTFSYNKVVVVRHLTAS